MTRPLSAKDWFGKASAGLILGFLIALGTSGLTAIALGVHDTYFSTRGQFTMWLIGLIWPLILAFCFLFRSGPRAWAMLGVATLTTWTSLYLLGGTAW